VTTDVGQQKGHAYPSVTEGLRNLRTPVRVSTPLQRRVDAWFVTRAVFRRTGGPTPS